MNNHPLIELKNIGKTYATEKVTFEALKNINLNIHQGEYISILGPSGSGKSTLMQIIGCLSTPTVGDYFLDGQLVSQLSRNELAKVRNGKIGFVFQQFNLLPQADLIDNVSLPLFYSGVSIAKRHQKAAEILDRLGLSTHLKHRPNELSGGQQQRVAIARALVTNPDVILADEPTGNLDSKSGCDVIRLFEEFSAEGKTIIIITHDHEIARRTKRIINIQDGMIKD